LGLRELAAKALFNKGVSLNELKKHDKAIECHDEVINRFDTTEDLSLRNQGARKQGHKFQRAQKGRESNRTL
jgi:hypothetical protein